MVLAPLAQAFDQRRIDTTVAVDMACAGEVATLESRESDKVDSGQIGVALEVGQRAPRHHRHLHVGKAGQRDQRMPHAIGQHGLTRVGHDRHQGAVEVRCHMEPASLRQKVGDGRPQPAGQGRMHESSMARGLGRVKSPIARFASP